MKKLLYIFALCTIAYTQVFTLVGMDESGVTIEANGDLTGTQVPQTSQVSAIRDINHIEFTKKIISIPDGYDTMREHGNVFRHDGHYIFISTLVRKVDGINEYTLHYWTAYNRFNWSYQGRINMARQGEDASLTFYDGQYHLFFEDKNHEKDNRRFVVNHYISDTIDGEFTPAWNQGYRPEDTGIPGIEAVYSPVADLIRTLGILIVDWRVMAVKPHTENVGITYQADPWSPLTTILLSEDYGYASYGVNGSIHQVDGVYVLETSGLIDYVHGGTNHKWVNGMVECETLTGEWRMLNKALVDQAGNYVWSTFFKENGKWYALAQLRSNKTEIYLAEIVVNETPPVCVPNWQPDTDTVRWLTKFVQTDGCGNSREAIGTDNIFDLPDPISTVGYNVVLMREARPLLFELKLDSIDTIKRDRIIDLIDEVSGGDR